MFGLIYTALTTLGIITNEIKESLDNKECKEKYKNIDGLTYTDSKGHSRMLSNNKMVFYTHNSNGDYILEDLSGNVIKNFSLEKRMQKQAELKQIALNEKASTYCIDENSHRNDWICQGKRFKDIKTGEIYVIRCIDYKYYYMNINNGFIVRKTDWQIAKEQKGEICKYLNKDLDIDSFNEKQKLVKDRSKLFRNFQYDSSCDYNK